MTGKSKEIAVEVLYINFSMWYSLGTIYQNYRHRDRPFANTHWELVINQRDESVNQDINVQSLSDIRLYVYYSDLTTF